MAQIIGNPGFGYGGHQLGTASGGPVAIFFGVGNPANIADTSLDRVTVVNCSPGSLFIATDSGSLYKKNSAGTWAVIAA